MQGLEAFFAMNMFKRYFGFFTELGAASLRDPRTALYLSNKHDTDIITYNACISACEGAGQWGTAVLLLRRAQD